MHSLLSRSLRAAFDAASTPIQRGFLGRAFLWPTGGGSYQLKLSNLVKEFKSIWIYKNAVSHPIDYDRFSGSLFLLLHKNISVTNISCEEVLSLLRIYTFASGKEAVKSANISFFSDDEYTRFLHALFDSLISNFTKETGLIDENGAREFIDLVSNNYGTVLETTLIVNFYYTSTLVHVPISMFCKVRNIIAESGYIHSGGSAIYTRKADKAKIVELHERLQLFIDGYSDHKVFITPYADEFFSPYDLSSVVSIRNGLAGVKLQLKKHFIEGQPLLDYLATLPKSLNVYVPLGIKSYAEERRDSLKIPTEKKGTIWFIADHALSGAVGDNTTTAINENRRVEQSSENPYLFVYEQAFINDNQFIIFKERKPGWYASITLPHTLSIAMTNLTLSSNAVRARNHSSAPVVVLDPFYGTGTTLFDAALRLGDNAVIIGFDRDPMAGIAAMDNALFFSLGPNDLQRKIELIDAGVHLIGVDSFENLRIVIAEALQDFARDGTESNARVFATALNLIDLHVIKESRATGHPLSSFIKKTANHGFSKELLEYVSNQEAKYVDIRFSFYIIWRAIVLGTFSIRDKDDNVISVIRKELERTRREIDHIRRCMTPLKTDSIGNFSQRPGLYSNSLSIDPSAMARLRVSTRHLTVRDMEEKMKEKGSAAAWEPGVWLVQVDDSVETLKLVEGQIDILLTDPPYGFNVEEDGNQALMRSFGDLGTALVAALRPQGQLAMVLPALAKNGRQIPFYETGGVLTRQLIAAAQRTNKNFVSEVNTVPKPKELFSKPYYWVSTTVLERRILHFSLSQ
jgi:hypothetical protein